MADKANENTAPQKSDVQDPNFTFGETGPAKKIDAVNEEVGVDLPDESGDMSMANLHFGTRPEADLLKSEDAPQATDAAKPSTALIGSDPDLDAAVVAENVEGASVGILASYDVDAVYTVSDERFEVVEGELRLVEGVSLNFEETAALDLTVTSTALDGTVTDEIIQIEVVDINEAPFDLALEGNAVAENAPGAVIGSLSSVDPDSGDIVTYTVSDDRFEVVDGELRLAEGVSLDHEEAASIDVTVTATDIEGLSTTETFTIDVVDVNEGPSDLGLDGNTVAENAAGASVGTLSSIDPDADDTVTYTVSDERFEVVDGELRLAEGVSLDHEAAESLDVTVTATDSGGLETSETFSINVSDVNETPTDLSLDGASVAENDAGAVIGTLSSFDPDAGDSVTYTVSDERFEVVDGELRLAEGVSLDHEAAESLDVTVTATDEGGLSTSETFTVDVLDVNEGPSDLSLEGSSVAENAAGATVGTLSAIDPDAGDSLTYTVSDDRFEVVDGELRLVDGVSLDHEEAAVIDVEVTATDVDGLSTVETFSIDVVDVNEGPSDLALDGSSVAENDAGAVIGTLSSFDPDADDTATYSVSDDRFEVVDGELRLAEGVSLDHEEADSLDIEVTVTDGDGLATSETFTVNVQDVNEGPSDLSLDGSSVAENAAGAPVGTLSSFDPDAGDSVTYSVSDDRFEVVDGELRLAEGVSLDHEEAASIDVEVTATDAGGLSTSETFSIDVADVNEGPSDLSLDGSSVAENSAGATVGTLSSFDPDAGDSVTYSVSDDRFEVVDGELRLAEGVSLDHEEAASITVEVTATDAGGLSTSESFDIDVADVNEAPSDLSLDGSSVAENDAGATVGTLSSFDPDAGDSVTYSVSDDRFEIVDGELRLADGVSLNHEDTDSVNVTVTATDADGLSTDETFTVEVTDVNEAPTDLTLSRDTSTAEADFAAGDGHNGQSVERLGLESDQIVFTMSFTTGDDVEAVQTLFETGGTVYGTNVVINDGMLEVYAGEGNDLELSVPIEADTSYSIALELDTDGDTIKLLMSDELPLSEMNENNSLVASHDEFTDRDYTGSNNMAVGDDSGNAQGRLGGDFQGTIEGPGLEIFSDSTFDDVFVTAGVEENTEGAVVGTLSAMDPDVGDSLTFTVSDDRFEVVDGELRLTEGVTLDHEAEPLINVTVTATDEGGLSTSETFAVDVVDLNEAPTDLDLDNNSIDEGLNEGVVGTVSVTDPDIGDTHTFRLVDNEDMPLAIDANTGEISLVTPGVPDGSVLRIDATDMDGLSVGDTVSSLQDLSGEGSVITQSDAAEQPVLVADGPFGQQGLQFDGQNDRLDIADDAQINMSTQSERSFALTIKTGDDVDTRQVIYEEGGTVNGFNFYIDDGQLYMGAWSESTGWNFQSVAVDVEPGESYSIAAVYDGEAGTFTGYVNGEEIGSVDVGDTMSAHSGNIGLGGIAQHTVFHDGDSSANDGFYFEGSIGEFAIFNEALESSDVAAIDMDFRGIAPALDFESQDSYELTVEVTDAAGATYEETFTIDVNDVNEGPVDLQLDGSSVAENAAGATVGTLSSFDPDADDSVTYTVSDDRFEVVDGELRLVDGESLDHETAESLEVTVTATDEGGLSTSETFEIEVSDVNEAPSDLSLDGSTVAENDAGATVGTLSSFDPDAGDSVTYSVSDDRFEVVDGDLRLVDGESLDHEAAESLDITVTATDGDGLSTSETFTIDVADVNEAPSDLALDGTSVAENSSGATVGTLSSFDPDAGDSVTYSVSDDRFEVVDGELRLVDGESLDHETAESLDVTVTATDSDGLATSETFEISVTDVNEAPSDLSLDGSTVAENDAGATVGTLSSFDPDAGDSVTYSVSDDRFEVVDGELRLADGVELNHEEVESLQVEVTATDSEGLATSETFTVDVADVNEAPTDLELSGGPDAFLEQGGLLVIEAENYDGSEAGVGHAWSASDTDGMMHVDDGANAYDMWRDEAAVENDSPELSYSIHIDTPGTYYVHVLGAAEDGPRGNADSVHIGIDGERITDDGGLTGFGSSPEWGSTDTYTGDVVAVTFDSAGTHELNLWAREDGVSVDQIVLTNDPNFDPGAQPLSESPRMGDMGVVENDAGAVVGTLSSFDPDAGDSVTYTVSDDRFEVVDGELRLVDGESLDHEDAASVDVEVTATDSGGLSTTETFSIEVSDVNEGPSDLSLDGTTIAENDAGATVGTLSSFDPDAGDSVTYTVSDDRFEVVDGELRLVDGESLDHEAADSLDITVTATDSDGLATSETFTLDVTDVNEAPTDIELGAQEGVLSLNQDGGNDDNAISANVEGFPSDALTVEVTFTADDMPQGSGAPLFSYSASSGNGGNDVLLWAESSSGQLNIFLDGNKFRTDIENSDLFDGEEHTVSMTWDQDSGEMTVYVDGVAEYSQSVNVSSIDTDGTITLGQEQDREGGRYDDGQIFEGEIAEVRLYDEALSEEQIADNAGGELVQDGLVTHWDMSEVDNGVVIDQAGNNDLVLENDAQVTLTNGDGDLSVDENAEGAVVGTLSSFDPDAGDSVAYTVSDDRFEVVDGEVRLKDGESLDHESAETVDLTVTATDDGGLSSTETFTIEVNDLNEAPTNIAIDSSTENLVMGGSFEAQDVNTGGWRGFSDDPSGTWDTANGMEVWDNLWGTEAAEGSQFIELDYTNAADAISQTVTTEPGQVYTLSLDVKSRDGAGTDTIEIYWNGELVDTVEPGSTDWETVSFDVVGTGGDDVLEFREAADENNSLGAHMDNITLVEVPLTLAEGVEGAVVGTLSAFDPDAGDGVSYAVSDPRFEIVDGELKLADGVSLDYESEQSVEVSVTATDSAGLESTEDFTINVADMDDGPTVTTEEQVATKTAAVESGEIITGNGGGSGTSTVTLDDISTGSSQIVIDFAQIDNSFQVEVNGQSLTDEIMQLQSNAFDDSSEVMLVFEDGSAPSAPWVPSSDGSPRFQVVVSDDGVEIYGTRNPGSGDMEPMTLDGGSFNSIDLVEGDNSVTVINPDGSGPDGLEASVSGSFDTMVEVQTVTGTDADDTITSSSGDDVLIGGDGDDLFIFEAEIGNDTVNGGEGWTDTLDLTAATDNGAVYGDDWTITLTEGEILSEDADFITLSDDAAGLIEFETGETIDFSNIEQIGF